MEYINQDSYERLRYQQKKLVDAWVSELHKSVSKFQEPQFTLLTICPHRRESSHLNDWQRKDADSFALAIHRSIMDRAGMIYRSWNRKFFKYPSHKIGQHLPAFIMLDDPITHEGFTHDQSQGPHLHVILGGSATHIAKFRRMYAAGHLRKEVQARFPGGTLHIEPDPIRNLEAVTAYGLKYHFSTNGATECQLHWRKKPIYNSTTKNKRELDART